MLTNLRAVRTLKGRFEYLLEDREGAEVVWGDPYLQLELARELPDRRKRQAYSILVAFAESRSEFLRKLQRAGINEQEFIAQLLQDIFPGYELEDLSVSVVGHSDTLHYHYHITVLNHHLGTGKALYVPFEDPKRFQLIDRKWELRLGLSTGGKGKALTSHKVGSMLGAKKDKEKLKEEITSLAAELLFLTEDREDLARLVAETLGLEVNRMGRNYVSFKLGNTKIRLKGGIWDDGEYRRIKAENRGGQRRADRDVQAVAEEVEQELERRNRRIRERVQERLAKSKKRACHGREEKEQVAESTLALGGVLSGPFPRISGREVVEQTTSLLRDAGLLLGPAVPKLEGVPASRLCSPSLYLIQRTASEMKEKLKRKRMWELEKIKQVPPDIFLEWAGLPYIAYPGEVITWAVWREDHHPSVSIQRNERGEWLWHDFGSGEGGSWIDFYMKLTGADYKTAVFELRENFVYSSPDLNESPGMKLPSSLPKVRKKLPVLLNPTWSEIERADLGQYVLFLEETKNKASEYLGKYALEVPPWLEEIKVAYVVKNRREWSVADRDLKAVGTFMGIKTVNGGWSLRELDGSRKMVLGTGGISYLPGSNEEGSKAVFVVEGLRDAIVAWNWYGMDVLVLNGVANISKALDYLRKLKDVEIWLALDNDEAGRRAQAYLLEAFPQAQVVYYEGKDLWEAHVQAHNAHKMSNFTLRGM